MVSIHIHQTEEEFANLDRMVGEIRHWLNASPDSRAGRGNMFIATMSVAGMTLQLHVKRDEDGEEA
jgi:hypothetical protein